MRHLKREALLKLDESTSMGLPSRDDVVVVRARGTKVWDASGKRYTDLFSGIAVANVGHTHVDVARAVSAQARRYMHVSNSYHNDVEPILAERLAPALLRGTSPGASSQTAGPRRSKGLSNWQRSVRWCRGTAEWCSLPSRVLSMGAWGSR